MHAFYGLVLLVVSAVISGILLGAMFAVVTTSINNFIIGPFFGASAGTYSFWIKFYMGVGGGRGPLYFDYVGHDPRL